MTPYQILGVNEKATQDEIKNAYRNLAKKHHPDLNPGNKEAERHFKEINGAYESVGTAEARAKYARGESDAQAQAQSRAASEEQARQYYSQTQSAQGGGRYSSAFGGMDEDLFESLFRGGGRGGGRGPSARSAPPDDLFQMEIDFADSILGAEREITLPSQKKLRITIPAGIESGKKLKFAAQGTQGGDLLIEISVRPSKVFTRHQNNLETEVSVRLADALLGAEITVPTLSGSLLMKIPELVNSGQKLRAAGKGVPAHAGQPVGDLLVKLKIAMPSQIDAEFKAAVSAWAQREKGGQA